MVRSAAILASLGCALVSGCALTTDRIPINYVGSGVAAKIDKAEDAKVDVRASDGRSIRKVSAKKNGYGMEMAPIEATNDVTQTVGKAIETELAKRGFSIGAGGATVAVEVVRFYNDFKIGFFAGDAVADVTLSVSVKNSDGTSTFAKSISGQGVNSPIQITSGENAQIALQRALQDAVNKLVDDRGFIDAILTASTAPSSPRAGSAEPKSVAHVSAPQTAPDRYPENNEFLLVGPMAPAAMVGQQFYLCCNLIFDGDGETTDANYLLSDDSNRILLPLGTAVTVTKAGRNYVDFVAPQGHPGSFELSLEYGSPAIAAEQYFPLILRKEDPAPQLTQQPPTTVLDIRNGRLSIGMSRAEAAMARGFPPFHQTAGLQAPTWLYYDDPDVGQYVTFSDDRITAIRTGKTP